MTDPKKPVTEDLDFDCTYQAGKRMVEHFAKGERERIVKWLRERAKRLQAAATAGGLYSWSGEALEKAADAIEKGEEP